MTFVIRAKVLLCPIPACIVLPAQIQSAPVSDSVAGATSAVTVFIELATVSVDASGALRAKRPSVQRQALHITA